MSIRLDTNPLVANRVVLSALDGLGVLGRDVPTEGINGAPLLHQFGLNTDPNKEYRVQVTRWPSVSLTVFENSAFEISAPLGTYDSFEFSTYEDGLLIEANREVTFSLGPEATVTASETECLNEHEAAVLTADSSLLVTGVETEVLNEFELSSLTADKTVSALETEMLNEFEIAVPSVDNEVDVTAIETECLNEFNLARMVQDQAKLKELSKLNFTFVRGS